MTCVTKSRLASWSNAGMKTGYFFAGLTAIAIAFSGGAVADDIYKWIDDDGGVH